MLIKAINPINDKVKTLKAKSIILSLPSGICISILLNTKGTIKQNLLLLI